MVIKMNKFILMIIVSLLVTLGTTIYSKNRIQSKYDEQVSVNNELIIANGSFVNDLNEKQRIISELESERSKVEQKIVELSGEIKTIQEREKSLNQKLKKLMESKENESYLNTVIPDDVLNILHDYRNN